MMTSLLGEGVINYQSWRQTARRGVFSVGLGGQPRIAASVQRDILIHRRVAEFAEKPFGDIGGISVGLGGQTRLL